MQGIRRKMAASTSLGLFVAPMIMMWQWGSVTRPSQKLMNWVLIIDVASWSLDIRARRKESENKTTWSCHSYTSLQNYYIVRSMAWWLQRSVCNAESLGLSNTHHCVGTLSNSFTQNCSAPSMLCRLVVCSWARRKGGNIIYCCIVLYKIAHCTWHNMIYSF